MPSFTVQGDRPDRAFEPVSPDPPLAEVQRLCRHHQPHRPGRTDQVPAFSASDDHLERLDVSATADPDADTFDLYLDDY